MTIELPDDERELLVELLHDAYKDALHGLHHTDTLDYRDEMKRRVSLIEKLQARLESPAGPDEA
jgi:hypothetical protein